LIERQTERVLSMLETFDPALPLAVKLPRFVAGRARIFERIAPVRRAALVAAVTSPRVQEALADTARRHADDVATTFAPDLERMPDPPTARAALTVATSWDTWNGLRFHQHCSERRAEAAVVLLAAGVLAG